MLDAALDAYNAMNSTTSRRNGKVTVGAPEEYMPLFDDKLNDFSRKCRGWGLSSKQRKYCQVMKERNYENRIEKNTLTVHHWSHTWLGHVKDEDFVNVWEIVNTTRNLYLSNTYGSL